jgi:K+-transporting ATPase KdpF subunit
MIATLLTVSVIPSGIHVSYGYAIAAVIALFILGYLIYSLIKPEKF